MWVEYSKPRLFGHLLAHQIASSHFIDPADGIKHVKNFASNSNFGGKVIIEEKKKVVEEAKKDRPGIVIWTDRSKLAQENFGAAVSWKDQDLSSWKSTSVFLGKNKEVLDAELWAIAEGLETARKITVNNNNTLVTIFSNSREALIAIRQLTLDTSSSYLRNLIYQKNLDLRSNGHFVTIRWISSYVRLIGHNKADQSAKDKAHKGENPLEQWSLL